MWHCSPITWSLFHLKEQWHYHFLTAKSLILVVTLSVTFGSLFLYRTHKLHFWIVILYFQTNDILMQKAVILNTCQIVLKFLAEQQIRIAWSVIHTLWKPAKTMWLYDDDLHNECTWYFIPLSSFDFFSKICKKKWGAKKAQFVTHLVSNNSFADWRLFLTVMGKMCPQRT